MDESMSDLVGRFVATVVSGAALLAGALVVARSRRRARCVVSGTRMRLDARYAGVLVVGAIFWWICAAFAASGGAYGTAAGFAGFGCLQGLAMSMFGEEVAFDEQRLWQVRGGQVRAELAWHEVRSVDVRVMRGVVHLRGEHSAIRVCSWHDRREALVAMARERLGAEQARRIAEGLHVRIPD